MWAHRKCNRRHRACMCLHQVLYLYAMIVSLVLCGTLNRGNRDCFWHLCLLLEPLSSYWVALSSLKIKGGALSHCNLMCCVWFIYLDGLPFSEGNQRRSRWELGRGGERERGLATAAVDAELKKSFPGAFLKTAGEVCRDSSGSNMLAC